MRRDPDSGVEPEICLSLRARSIKNLRDSDIRKSLISLIFQLFKYFHRLFQMWKVVEAADERLREVRSHHQKKRGEFQERWEKIKKGKNTVENNKKKFKPFIREKQGKIEDGLARIEKEKKLQNQMVRDMKDLSRDFKIHNLAKV